MYVENDSNHDIREVRITLIQNVRFKFGQKLKNFKNKWELKKEKVLIKSKSERQKLNLVDIKIPKSEVSMNVELVKIEYILEISFDNKKKSRLGIPIIIKSIPSNSEETTQSPPPPTPPPPTYDEVIRMKNMMTPSLID